jgi:enoyl-CoA hydratase/carnithine racemase
LLLEDIKLSSQPLIKNGSAALWDIGDGVVAFEFTGKMNALDGDVMALIGKAIPLVQEKYKALVVYNEGSNFSAGANLGLPCSRSTSRHGAKSKSSSRVARRPTRRLNMRRSRW